MPSGIFNMSLIWRTDNNTAQISFPVAWEDTLDDYSNFVVERQSYAWYVFSLIQTIQWNGAFSWLIRYRHLSGQYAGEGFDLGPEVGGGRDNVAPYHCAINVKRLRAGNPPAARAMCAIPFIDKAFLDTPFVDPADPQFEPVIQAFTVGLNPLFCYFDPMVNNNQLSQWELCTGAVIQPWIGVRTKRAAGRSYYPGGVVPIP